MQVQFLGKRVGVEKAGKPAQSNAFLAMPDDVSSVGYVRYKGDLCTTHASAPGTKIIFGKNYHQIRVDGVDVLVMDEDNIYAVVQEPTPTAQ